MAVAASAFPRLSPSGRRVCAGEHSIVVDRSIDVGEGTSGQWSGEDTVFFTGQPVGAFLRWKNGAVTTVREPGFNAFAVAFDRWVGWRPDAGLIWHDSVVWPEWHSPALSETRWAAILGAGLYAGLGDGEAGQVVASGAREPRLTGNLLTWIEEREPHQPRIYGQRSHGAVPEFLSIPGERHHWAVPVIVDGQPWVLTHTDDRLLLYPWGSQAGYVVAPAPTHRPDARQVNDGRVRVGWDAERNVLGEAFIDMRTLPRSDLRPAGAPQPERVPDGTEIDLLPFLVGDASMWPRDGSHPLHQTWDGRNLHLIKFGNADSWERWVLDGDQFYLREDRSQSGAGDYSFHPGTWYRRRMKVGEWIDVPDNVLQRYEPGTCTVTDQHRLPYRIGLIEAWKHVEIGGILGTRDTVVLAYDPGGPHDTVETYSCAFGAGLYQWRVAEQDDPAKTHTTTFTERGGQHLTPRQGCWRRDLVPWPPNQPEPPDPQPPDPPKPDPVPVPVPEPKPNTMRQRITVKSAINDRTVCADRNIPSPMVVPNDPTNPANRGGVEVRANRDNWDNPGPWEDHEVEFNTDGTVSFRSMISDEITALWSGDPELPPPHRFLVCANRPDQPSGEAGPAERWQPVHVPEATRFNGAETITNAWALKNVYNGKFMSVDPADPEGKIVARGEAANENELFYSSVPLIRGTGIGGGHGRDAIGYLPPAGLVRMEGWALADDHGPRPMLSATLMDAETQFDQDRNRLAANLDYCRNNGVDFVRILSEVDWPGKEANPRRVEQTVETVRFCWERGMRTELTIFGSHSRIDRAVKMDWTRAVANALRDANLAEALALIEFINEGGGARVGPDECHEGLRIVHEYLPTVPKATTAPYDRDASTATGFGEQSTEYRNFMGGVASLATVHLDRGVNPQEGEYRICRQPWNALMMGYPFGSNEPAGPWASAQGANVMLDPNMQRVHANGTWLQRGAFHCWHVDQGVGMRTDAPLWEAPGLPSLSAVRAILPRDVANFQAKNWHWNDNPIESLRGVRAGNPQAPVRTHGLVAGGRVVLHILGNDFGADLRARQGMRLTRYSWDGTQYAAAEEFEIAAGRDFFAPPAPDQIYVGRFI